MFVAQSAGQRLPGQTITGGQAANEVAALLAQARQELNAGDLPAAVEAYRSVLEVEPDNAEAHFNLGLVVSRKGLWSQAIPHLRRAIQTDPTRAIVYVYLGEALNHVDDLHGALQAFQHAAELRPNNAKALYGMGIILDRMNRPEEAAQMYRRSRDLTHR